MGRGAGGGKMRLQNKMVFEHLAEKQGWRVFRSPDQFMYGVERLRANVSYHGDPPRWVQVLPPNGKGARHGKSAYTYQRATAVKWMAQLMEEEKR